ncbi:MAG: class I SAM-dependent methyltransferase [Anaerolineae bacterium]|nr:class I SAM-dependent methyltransferase [Anaerolineae bacterium]
MEKKFLRSSTYQINPADLRRRKLDAQRTIINAYHNALIRWYCRFRFHIINVDFLDTLEQHLAEDAHVLDIGCGFGLFALYYAIQSPARKVVGFDLSEPRIKEAQLVTQKLGLDNVTFFCQDAGEYRFNATFDAVVTLDLLHHVAAEVAERLIQQAYEALTPGGTLIVKDVNTRPVHKLYFTYALDKAMMPRSPVHYRSDLAWKQLMLSAGFAEVFSYPLNDYLPYPHMLIVARKAKG